MGATTDFKAAQDAIARALATVKSLQSDSNPALLKQALAGAASTLGEAQAAIEVPGGSSRSAHKLITRFPGAAGFKLVEGAQPLTDEMIVALEAAVAAYTGTIAAGAVIALAYTVDGWKWFINTESLADRSQTDALINSDVYHLADPAGRADIGVLGTLLLGDNNQTVTVYTTKPGVQISFDGPLIDLVSLPPDLQKGIATAAAAAYANVPTDPYPASIGVFIANVLSATDETPLGWSLVESADSVTSPGDTSPASYGADLSNWAGSVYADNGLYVGMTTVTNTDGTTTNVFVWTTNPGVGVHIDVNDVPTVVTDTAPTGDWTSVPTDGPTVVTSVVAGTGDFHVDDLVDLTSLPADVQAAVAVAVVAAAAAAPTTPYPDSIGILVANVTSADDGTPLGWTLVSSTDSSTSGNTDPMSYGTNLGTWANPAAAGDSSYVGTVTVTNPDASTTTVFVWTTDPGVGVHVDSGGLIDKVNTYTAPTGDWAGLSTGYGIQWPPGVYTRAISGTENYTGNYTDGLDRTFVDVGTITIPASLSNGITRLLNNEGVLPDQSTVNAIAIPYVTSDATDDSVPTYDLDNVILTDAWITDLQWLVTNGYTFSTVNEEDLDPQLCAQAMGLDPALWGYLGTMHFPNGATVLIFTTLPGVWGMLDGNQSPANLTVDTEGADSNVYNTGTWPFVPLTSGSGPALTFTSIEPLTGAVAGDPLVLTGTGFTNVIDVSFVGAGAVDWSIINDTTINTPCPAITGDSDGGHVAVGTPTRVRDLYGFEPEGTFPSAWNLGDSNREGEMSIGQTLMFNAVDAYGRDHSADPAWLVQPVLGNFVHLDYGGGSTRHLYVYDPYTSSTPGSWDSIMSAYGGAEDLGDEPTGLITVTAYPGA
jgi:hypothetical protein